MQPLHSAIGSDGNFEFLSLPDGQQAIRIAGARVGIEFVLRDYLRGVSPEALALQFPALTVEQIHATIAYYLEHRESVDAYLWETDRQWQLDERHARAARGEFGRALAHRLARYRERSDNPIEPPGQPDDFVQRVNAITGYGSLPLEHRLRGAVREALAEMTPAWIAAMRSTPASRKLDTSNSMFLTAREMLHQQELRAGRTPDQARAETARRLLNGNDW